MAALPKLKGLLTAAILFVTCIAIYVPICVVLGTHYRLQLARLIVYGLTILFTYFTWRLSDRTTAVIFLLLMIFVSELCWIPRFAAIP